MRNLKPLSFVLAALSLAVSATPAAAQMTGSRIGKNAGKGDVSKLMRIVAECEVNRRGKMVRSWLETLPGSEQEDRLMNKQLGDLGVCLEDRDLVMGDGSELLVTPKAVRFPLALAMARSLLAKHVAAPTLSKDSSPWFMAKLATAPDPKQVDGGQLAFQDFGHCVALANWTSSSMLILAEPGTAEERAAMSQLTPVLGPCLDKDSKIKLTFDNLRMALAEPMVHILMASSRS